MDWLVLGYFVFVVYSTVLVMLSKTIDHCMCLFESNTFGFTVRVTVVTTTLHTSTECHAREEQITILTSLV